MSETFVLLLLFSAIAFVARAIFSPTSYPKSVANPELAQPEAVVQPPKPIGAGRRLYLAPLNAQKIPLALRHHDVPRSYGEMLDVIWQHGGVVDWFEQAARGRLDALGCRVVEGGETAVFPTTNLPSTSNCSTSFAAPNWARWCLRRGFALATKICCCGLIRPLPKPAKSWPSAPLLATKWWGAPTLVPATAITIGLWAKP